jgi:hypothetical protein
MAQKPVLRAEVLARVCLHASQNVKRAEVWVEPPRAAAWALRSSTSEKKLPQATAWPPRLSTCVVPRASAWAPGLCIVHSVCA